MFMERWGLSEGSEHEFLWTNWLGIQRVWIMFLMKSKKGVSVGISCHIKFGNEGLEVGRNVRKKKKGVF